MKRAAMALTLALLAGAAQAGLFDDEEARKGVEQSKKDITQLQAGAKSLDARLARIEEAVKSQSMLDVLNQIEALKQEIAKLRGQVEELKFAEETAQKRQKDFYVDLDTRLRRLEQPGAAAPGAVAPAPAPAAGMPPAPPVGETAPAPDAASKITAAVAAPPAAGQAGADTATEVRAYDAAYSLFKIGNYQGAIAGFQNFLKAYPNSIFTPNAYYWIGNAFFNLRDYRSAISTQQKLLAAHADSPKAPDAMLNIASSQRELGDITAEKKTLQDVVSKYPASDAAEKAKRRLATIR
ncbi:MAG TPA: tol-pal system protein YbgF [Burkholderiales bacterium]|nr:tol-pal system protein YbgF [Burkholderiales bacterium]